MKLSNEYGKGLEKSKIFQRKAILFGIVGLLLIGSAFAYMGYGGMGRGMMGNRMGVNHEQMEEVMEQGTFSDLQRLRQETGFNIMPWVNDEATFKQMQDMHEKMEKYMESSNWKSGMGMMASGRANGNCPMMG